MLKIEDLYHYQEINGHLGEPVKVTHVAVLEAVIEEIVSKVGIETYEKYNDLRLEELDSFCKRAYTQGFKDGASISRELEK